jgi:hypothetical protein
MMAVFANHEVDFVSRPGWIERASTTLSLGGWAGVLVAIALTFGKASRSRRAEPCFKQT